MDKRPRRRATVIDIARAAGVSPGTVSNALGGRRAVDPETRARVLRAAEDLHYVPSVPAQRLRAPRADTIGLFMALPMALEAGGTGESFTIEVAAMAAAVAAEQGMALMLVPPLADGRVAPRFLDIDGALCLEPVADDPVIAMLRARGVPVVSVGAQPGGRVWPHVDLRSAACTRLLLEHLAGQGSARMALVLPRLENDLRLLAEATYRRFCRARGEMPLVLVLDERRGEDEASALIGAFLAAHPAVDGLCVPYDPLALWACRKARAMGRALRVVTRYNSVRVQEAGITALDIQLPQVARLATERLLAAIASPEDRTPARIRAPAPRLLVRPSSL